MAGVTFCTVLDHPGSSGAQMRAAQLSHPSSMFTYGFDGSFHQTRLLNASLDTLFMFLPHRFNILNIPKRFK